MGDAPPPSENTASTSLPPPPEDGTAAAGVQCGEERRQDDVGADEYRAAAPLEFRQDDGGDVRPPPRAGDDGSRDAGQTADAVRPDVTARSGIDPGPDEWRVDVTVPGKIRKCATEELRAVTAPVATEHECRDVDL